MAGGGSKRKRSDADRRALDEQLADIPPDRPGLPARDSIESVETFVSPQNEEYKILHTTETDAYDPPPKPSRSKRRRRPT